MPSSLPKVTAEDVLSWGPCWLEESDGEDRVRCALHELGEEFDALGLLSLGITPSDAMWLVLRPQVLPGDLADRVLLDMLIRAHDKCKTLGVKYDADLVDAFIGHAKKVGVGKCGRDLSVRIRSARDFAYEAQGIAREDTPEADPSVFAHVRCARVETNNTLLMAVHSMAVLRPCWSLYNRMNTLFTWIGLLEELVSVQQTDPDGFDFVKVSVDADMKYYAVMQGLVEAAKGVIENKLKEVGDE